MGKAVVATPLSMGGLQFADAATSGARAARDLAEAVVSLIEDSEFRARLGQRARETM